MNASATSRSTPPFFRNRRPGLRGWTLLVAASLGLGAISAPADEAATVMPLPAEQSFGTGALEISSGLTVRLPPAASLRLRAAVDRLLQAWSHRTGINFDQPAVVSPATAALTLDCARSGSNLPELNEDESYDLVIDSHHAVLKSAQDLGALRGLATLTQLLTQHAGGWSLPVVSIKDAPRYSWRGLLIDVSRHWMPLPVIKRNLDAMELVKLNVLHLHLSDDQGFRVESRIHPEIQAQGSDGKFYRQAEIKSLVDYAAMRGIRVVPEFDVPGHSTSWFVSHPELASRPGPYQIERQFTVSDPVFDPTNEQTYRLLNEVLGEMGELFPDKFMHIGGDENNGHQWTGNPAIQRFICEHGLKDNAGLQTYFNQRIDTFLISRGKRVVGWDEILHPDLPRDAVIDSWRGSAALAEAARLGFSGIMANGYYLDHCEPASDHYLNDPIPPGSRLTAAEQARIMGGEAAMWAELVGPETIDSRIWPRTAAIAERFWSAQEVRDVKDMYRRLAVVSDRLTEKGVQHESTHQVMLYHLVAPNTAPAEMAAFKTFVSLLEPQGYDRLFAQPWRNQTVPLTSLADAARPDSRPAREWMDAVSNYVFAPGDLDPQLAKWLQSRLEAWQQAAETVLAMSARRECPALWETKQPAQAIVSATTIAREAIESLAKKQVLGRPWRIKSLAVLDQCAAVNPSATKIPFFPAVRLLVVAACEPSADQRLSSSERKTRIEALAESNQP